MARLHSHGRASPATPSSPPPEIPCSFAPPRLDFPSYQRCVSESLDELIAAGVLDPQQRGRFLSSAIRAYHRPDDV